MLESDRHVTYCQIEECSDISAMAIHTILHDHLQVRIVCSLRVPHALTYGQMVRHVWSCCEMLNKFENGTSRYVNSILPSDETWLYL
jgi:hypothetical protein